VRKGCYKYSSNSLPSSHLIQATISKLQTPIHTHPHTYLTHLTIAKMHSAALSVLLAPLVAAAAFGPAHGPAPQSSSTTAHGAQVTNVCASKPYEPLLGLSQLPLAEIYCQQHFPQNVKTMTTTMTYTAPHGLPTPGPAAPGKPSPGKGQIGRPGQHFKRNEANWASALARGEAFLSTLCSCIETPKTATMTTTVYPSSSSSVSSSLHFTPSAPAGPIFTGSAAPSPIFPSGNATMPTVSKMPFDGTVTVTVTNTVSYPVTVHDTITATVTATVTAGSQQRNGRHHA